MVWKPNVTVAAVIEANGKFLLVEEHTERGVRFNQPAGHLEPNESLIEGVQRETLEETAYGFMPEALVGIYRWHYPQRNVTYLRFAFSGRLAGHDPTRKLDAGIIRAVWLAPAEIRGEAHRHRSPLVLKCMEDYLAGKRYSLDIFSQYA